MDDLQLHLLPRKETPPLSSDFTLWEMDDVELSEPVLLPETGRSRSLERNQCSVTIPYRSSTKPLAVPWNWPGSSAGTQYEQSLWNFQSPSEIHKASIDQSSNINTRIGCSRVEPQELTSSVRDGTQISSESSRNCSSKPCPPALPRAPPSEMSFMELHPGDATISYLNDIGKAQCITGISVQAIEQSCPLLAAAFEPRSSGPQLYLESLSEATATPFLRYLYTGSYATNGESGDVYENVPSSLLLHCQLFHLGYLYDLRALMQQANVNIIRQCEFGCSSPDKPIHLSAAIKYAYEHLSGHAGVLETIISYCVSCFLRHRLAEDEDFKLIAFELKPFHQALCRESMDQRFENETASAIIRMPFKTDKPDVYLSREDTQRIRDVVHYSHSADAFDSVPNARVAIDEKRLESKQYALSSRTLLALKAFQERSGEYRAALGHLEQPNAQEKAQEAAQASSSARYAPTAERLVRSRSPVRRQSPSRGDFVFPDMRSPDHGCMQASSSIDANSNGTMESQLSSDLEYEFVDRSASFESVSSESEAEEPGLLDRAGLTQPTVTLPIRRRNIDRSSSSSGSSDSEWTLI